MDEIKQNATGFRAFISMVLFLSFLAMGLTGILFLVALAQRNCLGLDKEVWETLHINMGVLVLIVAIVHLVLNWKVIGRYLCRKQARGVNWPVLLAVLFVAIVIGGTVLNVPPFGEIHEFHEHCEQHGDASARTPS